MNINTTPPERNPENTIGAAFIQFKKKFAVVLFLGLLFWSAPQMLLVFLDNLPGALRIDLSGYMAQFMGELDEETVALLKQYGELGVFSISPYYIAASVLMSLAITPLFYGCCSRLAFNGYYGVEEDTAALLSATSRRYLKIIGANICSVIASLLICLVAAIPIVAAVVVMALGGGLMGLPLLFAGLFACLVAGLIVSALQLMSIATAQDEGVGGFRAVLRTVRMLRVRFLKNIFAIFIANMAASYITSAVQNLFSYTGEYIFAAMAASIVGGVLSVFPPMCAARCCVASRLSQHPPVLPESIEQ